MKDYMSENYFENETSQDGIVGFGKFMKLNTKLLLSTYDLNVLSVSYKKTKVDDEKMVRLSFHCQLNKKENLDYQKLDSSVLENIGHVITLNIVVPIEETNLKWLTFKGLLNPSSIYGLEGFVLYGGITLKATGVLIGDEWIGKKSERPNQNN